MPSKRGSKQKKSSPQERKSGRQSSKQIKYTEEGSDDYSSGSENEIHEEIDKIIENIPARKQSPKKDKNVRNQGRQEKRKVDDSESEKETDEDSETAENIPARKQPLKKDKNVRNQGRQEKRKVDDSESEKETDEDSETAENIPARKQPPKKDKKVRNQGRQEKRKVDDSESEKEADEDHETAEETPTKRQSKKKEESKQSPAKKQKTKVNHRPDEDDDSCQICKRTSKVTIRGGVQCCAACQAFFKKHYDTDSEELECKEDDNCELDSTKYLQICSCCRYKKCVELGMEAEEESIKEGERKSTRIRSLEKNYKESDSESEDIYIPIAKKKTKPNYYESSDENAVVGSSEEEDDGDDPNDLNWNPTNRSTFEDVAFGKKKKKYNCDVCRDWAYVETHYGIRSCSNCGDLFRKALIKHHIPRCIKKNKQCDVKSGKSKCSLCKISRYLKLTMESDRYIDNDNIKEKAESLEELLLSDNPQKLAMRKNKCEICGALADGLSKDVKTCSSCTVFYRNCTKGKVKVSKLKCLQSDMCKLSRGEDPVKYKYSHCKDCRYKKCLKIGMAKGNRPADE